MSNRGIVAGAVLDGTDWKLPAIVASHGNGTNTITSTTFAVLPTTTVSASITNPHPSARLLVLAEYGAWLIGNLATGDVKAGLAASGALVCAAGIGGGGPVGWGEILYATSTSTGQHSAVCTYEIPVSGSAAVFVMHAMSNGIGTVNCNYPTIRLTPLRYVYSQGRSS